MQSPCQNSIFVVNGIFEQTKNNVLGNCNKSRQEFLVPARIQIMNYTIQSFCNMKTHANRALVRFASLASPMSDPSAFRRMAKDVVGTYSSCEHGVKQALQFPDFRSSSVTIRDLQNLLCSLFVKSNEPLATVIQDVIQCNLMEGNSVKNRTLPNNELKFLRLVI